MASLQQYCCSQSSSGLQNKRSCHTDCTSVVGCVFDYLKRLNFEAHVFIVLFLSVYIVDFGTRFIKGYCWVGRSISKVMLS